jgi:hypothetical protein
MIKKGNYSASKHLTGVIYKFIAETAYHFVNYIKYGKIP